jgi:hypothetical protein
MEGTGLGLGKIGGRSQVGGLGLLSAGEHWQWLGVSPVDLAVAKKRLLQEIDPALLEANLCEVQLALKKLGFSFEFNAMSMLLVLIAIKDRARFGLLPQNPAFIAIVLEAERRIRLKRELPSNILISPAEINAEVGIMKSEGDLLGVAASK